jgi:phosphatidylinositol glycan class N
MIKEESENSDEDDDDAQNLNWSNMFRVYLLVFHLLISFFGTGNMASINSFDAASVYTFETVFSPFLMGFLLMLKVIVPFLIVIVAFYCIYEVIDLSIGKLYILLMVISDLMALVRQSFFIFIFY